MKLFEEICDKYYRREEDLEKDLMAVLRNKSTEEVLPGHINGDYKMALMDLLEKMGLLEDKVWYRLINKRGKEVIERGWIIKDYATPKKQEKWRNLREWTALLVAIILGILGFFFPR